MNRTAIQPARDQRDDARQELVLDFHRIVGCPAKPREQPAVVRDAEHVLS